MRQPSIHKPIKPTIFTSTFDEDGVANRARSEASKHTIEELRQMAATKYVFAVITPDRAKRTELLREAECFADIAKIKSIIGRARHFDRIH